MTRSDNFVTRSHYVRSSSNNLKLSDRSVDAMQEQMKGRRGLIARQSDDAKSVLGGTKFVQHQSTLVKWYTVVQLAPHVR